MSDPMLGAIRDGRHPDHFCGISPCPHIPASQQRVERGGPVTAASREALDWVQAVEVVTDPAGNTIWEELRTNFLPLIEHEAAEKARRPLLDALDRVGGQAKTIRAELARFISENRPADMGTLRMWEAGLRAALREAQ